MVGGRAGLVGMPPSRHAEPRAGFNALLSPSDEVCSFSLRWASPGGGALRGAREVARMSGGP